MEILLNVGVSLQVLLWRHTFNFVLTGHAYKIAVMKAQKCKQQNIFAKNNRNWSKREYEKRVVYDDFRWLDVTWLFWRKEFDEVNMVIKVPVRKLQQTSDFFLSLSLPVWLLFNPQKSDFTF